MGSAESTSLRRCAFSSMGWNATASSLVEWTVTVLRCAGSCWRCRRRRSTGTLSRQRHRPDQGCRHDEGLPHAGIPARVSWAAATLSVAATAVQEKSQRNSADHHGEHDQRHHAGRLYRATDQVQRARETSSRGEILVECCGSLHPRSASPVFLGHLHRVDRERTADNRISSDCNGFRPSHDRQKRATSN